MIFKKLFELGLASAGSNGALKIFRKNQTHHTIRREVEMIPLGFAFPPALKLDRDSGWHVALGVGRPGPSRRAAAAETHQGEDTHITML